MAHWAKLRLTSKLGPWATSSPIKTNTPVLSLCFFPPPRLLIIFQLGISQHLIFPSFNSKQHSSTHPPHPVQNKAFRSQPSFHLLPPPDNYLLSFPFTTNFILYLIIIIKLSLRSLQINSKCWNPMNSVVTVKELATESNKVLRLLWDCFFVCLIFYFFWNSLLPFIFGLHHLSLFVLLSPHTQYSVRCSIHLFPEASPSVLIIHFHYELIFMESTLKHMFGLVQII